MNTRNEENAKNIKINKFVVQNPPSEINIINPPPKLHMQPPNTFNFTTPMRNLSVAQQPVSTYVPNQTYTPQTNDSISLWGDVKTLSLQPPMTFNKFPSNSIAKVNNEPTFLKPININPTPVVRKSEDTNPSYESSKLYDGPKPITTIAPQQTVYQSPEIKIDPIPPVERSEVFNPINKSVSLFDGIQPMNSSIYQNMSTGENPVYPNYNLGTTSRPIQHMLSNFENKNYQYDLLNPRNEIQYQVYRTGFDDYNKTVQNPPSNKALVKGFIREFANKYT